MKIITKLHYLHKVKDMQLTENTYIYLFLLTLLLSIPRISEIDDHQTSAVLYVTSNIFLLAQLKTKTKQNRSEEYFCWHFQVNLYYRFA